MLASGSSARWTAVRLRKPKRRLFTPASTRCSSSPSAFKQHPDIAHIRDNVALHETNAVLRNYAQHRAIPAQVAARAGRISEINTALKKPRAQIKALQSRLTAKDATVDKARTVAEIRRMKPVVDKLVAEQDALEEANRRDALLLPNLTSPHTPVGDEPRLISYINYDPLNPPPQTQTQTAEDTADHSAIGEELGLIDFASASMASGWGFYYLLNEGALLEQALIQYALAVARRHGWQVATPPSLVYSHVADACGFQPRDNSADELQQIWQVAQPARDSAAGKPRRSLAATAEIPLAALHAGKDMPAHALPVRLVGSSRCFRAEAGARGVDTRGLYRVHEFTKVVAIQTDILSALGLPCRVLEMPTADLGASAFRKIDIEALFPSRRHPGWGELTSASICTDYQARRLDTRILDPSGSRKKFPHTINGTAVAVPRVLAAILEHGWRPRDRCVVIPEPLRPYMDGMAVIQRAR
ncbi:hypothetical protein DV735_g3610, partial [Chaetothyriales sp. CBS 134920]